MMRIVIVGAGAVGQVYGHHLALGGAQVSVLVKPPRPAPQGVTAPARGAEARAGYTLTRIQPFGPRKTSTFLPEKVFTSALDLRGEAIDQIWLCLPTNRLDPVLLGDLSDAAPRATIVVLAPGHFVRALVDPIVGATRTVYGLIAMMSFVSPMKGSSDPRETATPAGVAYMLSTTKLGGSNEMRALEAVSGLRLGGCPADYQANISDQMTISSAGLMATVASLEVADWSFQTLREPGRVDLCARAMRESLDIAAAEIGKPAPFYTPLIHPQLISLASFLVPKLAPLDVERFLEVHFSKVDEQTTLLLNTTLEDGKRLGLATEALSELCALLLESRATASAAPAPVKRKADSAHAE